MSDGERTKFQTAVHADVTPTCRRSFQMPHDTSGKERLSEHPSLSEEEEEERVVPSLPSSRHLFLSLADWL